MSNKKRLSELLIYTVSILVLTFLSINSMLVYIVSLFIVPALVSYMCCISNKQEALLAIITVAIYSIK